MIRMHIWQRHIAKLITIIAICLITCELYGADQNRECPNGKCPVKQIVKAPVQVVREVAVPVYNVVTAPVRVIQSTPILHEAVPRIVATPKYEPVPNVCNCGKQHSQTPLRNVVATPVPQVYNTQSFHSNGSGISLADHLQTTHGINPSGMSVAEQEAAHQAAHGYGGRSSYRAYNRPKLFGW